MAEWIRTGEPAPAGQLNVYYMDLGNECYYLAEGRDDVKYESVCIMDADIAALPPYQALKEQVRERDERIALLEEMADAAEESLPGDIVVCPFCNPGLCSVHRRVRDALDALAALEADDAD